MAEVIIADDEAALRNVLAKILARAGHSVRCVCDGAEALRFLSEAPADVLVTDVSMPGVSGLSLLETVAREYPLLKVILMTGLPSVESASFAIRRGAFSYLVKPLATHALLKAVAQAAEVKALEESSLALRRNTQQRSREADHLQILLHNQRSQIRDPLSQMIEASRQAGMADMASRLMHFIGNTLNHASAASGVLATHRPVAVLSAIHRLAAYLEETPVDEHGNSPDDPRARAVVPYLRAIANKLEAFDQLLQHEVSTIQNTVHEVQTLLAEQAQSLGRPAIVERCNLKQIVAEYTDAWPSRLSYDIQVTIDECVDVWACRPELCRLIGGVLNFCKHRLERSPQPNGTLKIHGKVMKNGGVSLDITDNAAPAEPGTIDFEARFDADASFQSRPDPRLHEAGLAAARLHATLDISRTSAPSTPGIIVRMHIPKALEQSA